MSSPSPSSLKTVAAISLTAEQQAAVTAPDGPLLILAGAGTGKTRVIAHRIVHLLRSHPDWVPADILALTFSRKGAEEMRERVAALLGGNADTLIPSTFHSFCHQFLQDYALELGLPPGYRLLDRLEAWIFLRRLLPDLGLKQYLVLSDPASAIDGFLRFISRAKDELVTPEQLEGYAQRVVDPAERLKAQEIARVYRVFQERLEQAGQCDFGDLIVRAQAALASEPGLLKQMQSKYKAILVDEFQDTNVAQIELLKLLAGRPGHLTVVGDDDQAIYRFRGASFASFELIKAAYSGLTTLKLTKNFRSTPQILACTEALIQHNSADRYDPEKQLHAVLPKGDPVEVLVCQDSEDEAVQVVRILRHLKELEKLSGGWSDAAVLYRAHAHRDVLVQALGQAGIPFVVHGGAGMLDHPAIRTVMAVLRVLHDPSDAVELFHLIEHPIWGIPIEDAVALNRTAKAQRVSLRKVLAKLSSSPGSTAGVVISETGAEGAVRLHQELIRLEKTAQAGVAALLTHLVERSAFRAMFQLPLDAAGDPLMALGRFLKFTYRYVNTNPEANPLDGFLWMLDSAIEAGIDPTEEPERLVGDRVRLMTVHQAKGLEFPWVIILGLVQGRFPSRARREPIPFPDDMMKESLPRGDFHQQEERRLCYVACTRAQQGLFLMTQDRAYHRTSTFVQEMAAETAERIPDSQDSPDRAGENPSEGRFLKFSLTEVKNRPCGNFTYEREVLELLQQIRQAQPEDEAVFTRSLERLKQLAAGLRQVQPPKADTAGPQSLLPKDPHFSFSQLDSYRDCPLKFKYRYVYQIPVRSTPAMNFGTDLHVCLESFYLQVMKGNVPKLAELLDTFGRSVFPGRYGDPVQDETYQKLGVQILKDYYKKHEGAFTVPLMLEKAFLLDWGQAKVRGFIDRIDPLPDGGVEIMDYKSGKPKTKATADEQLQLRIYALAARESMDLKPKRISFYYLKSNEKLSYEPTDVELEATKERVMGLAVQIRSGDFTPKPDMMKCRWCDFKNLCPSSAA